MTARVTRPTVALLLAVLLSAHIGSPEIFFEGTAGPYQIRVVILPPQVIPGRASVTIETETSLSQVTVVPYRYDLGLNGAPAGEVVKPTSTPGRYATEVWLTTLGSYAIRIQLDGPQGQGVAVIPVPALANARQPMPPLLGVTLALLAVALVWSLADITKGATTAGALPFGEQPDDQAIRAGQRVWNKTLGLGGLCLAGFAVWWGLTDQVFQKLIYRPAGFSAELVADSLGPALHFRIDPTTARGRVWRGLTQEHGHLMHLFLVRQGDLGAMAHLHPSRLDVLNFQSYAPRLPPGRYSVFADVVHVDGFAETLIGSLDLPRGSVAARKATDSTAVDDAAWVDSDSTVLGDEMKLEWQSVPRGVTQRQEVALRFVARQRDGKPVELEPYLGMAGHLIVLREDRSVFVHLHPGGTVSPAAQQRLSESAGIAPAGHEMTDMSAGALEFRYAFPQPGRYRLWLQVRVGGRIHTKAFDVPVSAAGSPG